MSKWAITGIVIGAVFSTSWSGDFDYASYTQTTLQNIIMEEQEDNKAQVSDKKPAPDFQLECKIAKYRVSCRYSNDLRPISEKKKSLIMGWMEMFKFDTKFASLYKQEIRVSEGTSEHWIPIQEQLLPHIKQELDTNDRIELFIIVLGRVESEIVFIATEYEKPNAPVKNSLRATASLRAGY